MRLFWYYYNIFIKIFIVDITGCDASDLNHDDGDVIDVKLEPVEVSDLI